jgi:glycosyltransferase involved in cell wall biosynthesis
MSGWPFVRVALVHDYLTQYGGAERVLEVLHERFPDATVVTAILDLDALPDSFRRMRIVDGGLGRVPIAGRHHRAFVPVYPMLFRRLGQAVAEADVVIADSSAWAHHIGVRPDQALVCYCHSPARFLYGDPDYLKPAGLSRAANAVAYPLFAGLRTQDRRAALRVDRFLANSENVARRIAATYGRESRVAYPPVNLARFECIDRTGSPVEWFLVVSRLVPHKRVDLAIAACERAGVPLRVVGDGRIRRELESLAGSRTTFLGWLDDGELADNLSRCRALILPAAEDFGMTSVEAQAAGRPVIAFGKGGALESVIENETGLFFRDQTGESLAAAISAFSERDWDRSACRANAQRFGKEPFLRAIDEEVALAVEQRRRLSGL